MCLLPQLRTLGLLLLLEHHQLSDSSMIGFLLSLLGMKKCKKKLKEQPNYKTPGGSTVRSEGLFRALLADVVSEAFVIDVDACSKPEANEPGTKANVLCANLLASMKLRSTLRPIVQHIANSNLQAAGEKTTSLADDFASMPVKHEDVQAAQAAAKIQATVSVSLRKPFYCFVGCDAGASLLNILV